MSKRPTLPDLHRAIAALLPKSPTTRRELSRLVDEYHDGMREECMSALGSAYTRGNIVDGSVADKAIRAVFDRRRKR